MRHLLPIVLAGCLLGPVSPPVAAGRPAATSADVPVEVSAAASAATPAAESPAPFLAATDCFARWPTYDAWMDTIRARNAWWNPKVRLLPWIFPRADFERGQRELECRSIAYENDGLEILGWMVTPRGGSGRLPVLVYNRGGNGSFGALEFPLVMQNLFPYAHEGFIVLASQYRGATESEPERFGSDEFGGADVRDVTRLVDLVAQIPRADPDNIFMLGGSRGGMMSYMAARRTDRIRALAVVAGVTDLKAELRNRPEMENVYAARIPDYATRKDERLAERSVLAWAEELPPRMPVLILHGEFDDRVHVSNAVRLHWRLDELGHPNKLIVYAGDDHTLRGNREESVAEVMRWFRAEMAKPRAVAHQPAHADAGAMARTR